MSTSTTTNNVNPAMPAAHAVFEAINSKELSRLPELATADFVDHGSPFPLPPGPEGYAQILTFVTEVLSSRYEVEDLSCTPDRIVARAVAHGTAPVHGAEFAGRPYAMPTIHIFRTEGERL